MRIAFIGDIMGEPGRNKIAAGLKAFRDEHHLDIVIAQGENLAGGKGITRATAQSMFEAGVDCLTTGNHVWKHKEATIYLAEEPRVLRPANFPPGVPGRGWAIVKRDSVDVAVINLQGRVFMKPLDDPFRTADAILQDLGPETRVVIVDIHAEATAEKEALAHYLTGRVTALVGTHTHVPTADEQLLDNHTAYITDVGMVGARASIIGAAREEVIASFLTQMPTRFRVAADDVVANTVVIAVDPASGRALSIQRQNF